LNEKPVLPQILTGMRRVGSTVSIYFLAGLAEKKYAALTCKNKNQQRQRDFRRYRRIMVAGVRWRQAGVIAAGG
jgi:hypothetical protein